MARPGESSNWTSFGDLNWGGKFFRVLFFLALINAISLIFLQKDLWAMVGVEVISRTEMSIVFFIALAVYAWVNTEHHPSDQYWNAAMVVILTIVLAGNNIGVSINADEAVANAKEAATQGANNVRQQVKQVTVDTPAGPVLVDEVPVTRNHLWYNIFAKNANTGSAAGVCYELLSKGNFVGYTNRGCNTGAAITKDNIQKCQAAYKASSLNQVEKIGCGYEKAPYLQRWCNMEVGEKGQLRTQLCKN